MNTKERIIEEALTLFSQKGYQGTSVKEIAHAVGIKDSSLYKHYKSKQEIFDTITFQMEQKIQAMSESFRIPNEAHFRDSITYYGTLSQEDLVSLSQNVFLFYLKDPFLMRFRRTAMIEQYTQEMIYHVYYDLFFERSIQYLSKLFQAMIEHGYFIDVDANLIAMNFYTPIFFLLQKYDQAIERESEALHILKNQIAEFYRIYHVS